MRIDFVSDIACPWCAVGLAALEQALVRIGGDIEVELHFQPFELNPTLAPEGEDVVAHLARKYGITPAQVEHNRAAIRERGAAVGFRFGERTRIWNTFDAHRLLCWAEATGHARELQHALLRAYHGAGHNPGAHAVLLALAAEVGLPVEAARAVLAGDAFADEVREREQFWQRAGITAVPSVIVDRRHLIQGGQPPAVYERALREIAAAV